ncbi:hypothetical protein CEXT_459961 [Caerostris extrusa]|uniref:Uncharacterized protein n=1 Tax=Caerostris extrusa TaxID=172846 RepID=A0AAV4PAF0_CAEEX|nr:hypothetical protein CEXT_459961 [Caerostris extrusa]
MDEILILCAKEDFLFWTGIKRTFRLRNGFPLQLAPDNYKGLIYLWPAFRSAAFSHFYKEEKNYFMGMDEILILCAKEDFLFWTGIKRTFRLRNGFPLQLAPDNYKGLIYLRPGILKWAFHPMRDIPSCQIVLSKSVSRTL